MAVNWVPQVWLWLAVTAVEWWPYDLETTFSTRTDKLRTLGKGEQNPLQLDLKVGFGGISWAELNALGVERNYLRLTTLQRNIIPRKLRSKRS